MAPGTRPVPVTAQPERLMVRTVRLLIASEHPVVREGLLALLDAVDAGIQPVGTASDDAETLLLVEELRPDVVLLDMQLSGGDPTITLTRRIRGQHPEVRVVILSPTLHGSEVCRALDDGAGGVVSKTAEPPQLVQAIQYVASGEGCSEEPDRQVFSECPLSTRESDVLECISRGMSNAEIAFALGIARSTVKAHVEHILRKLGASDRTSAVAKAFRKGLIQ